MVKFLINEDSSVTAENLILFINEEGYSDIMQFAYPEQSAPFLAELFWKDDWRNVHRNLLSVDGYVSIKCFNSSNVTVQLRLVDPLSGDTMFASNEVELILTRSVDEANADCQLTQQLTEAIRTLNTKIEQEAQARIEADESIRQLIEEPFSVGVATDEI